MHWSLDTCNCLHVKNLGHKMCRSLWSLVLWFSHLPYLSYQSLASYLSVRANEELVKDVLTCTSLTPSTYKAQHPDDTDDPDAVGRSSEDEAEGMKEVLGISRHIQKPVEPEPSPTPPSVPIEEGVIRVQKKDLKRAQGILGDILAGRKMRAVSGASCEDVPFRIPTVQAGDRDCSLCHQSFASTKALRHHLKTHTGDTGWSCEVCGKVLSTKLMLELHTACCGKGSKQHNCKECGKGYTTKQAMVAHLKAKHGPPPTQEELTCPTCGKLFKVLKTMREHLAVHKGPYPCLVEGCDEGPYSLPKRLNRHLADKHGFAAHKQ